MTSCNVSRTVPIILNENVFVAAVLCEDLSLSSSSYLEDVINFLLFSSLPVRGSVHKLKNSYLLNFYNNLLIIEENICYWNKNAEIFKEIQSFNLYYMFHIYDVVHGKCNNNLVQLWLEKEPPKLLLYLRRTKKYIKYSHITFLLHIH